MLSLNSPIFFFCLHIYSLCVEQCRQIGCARFAQNWESVFLSSQVTRSLSPRQAGGSIPRRLSFTTSITTDEVAFRFYEFSTGRGNRTTSPSTLCACLRHIFRLRRLIASCCTCAFLLGWEKYFCLTIDIGAIEGPWDLNQHAMLYLEGFFFHKNKVLKVLLKKPIQPWDDQPQGPTPDLLLWTRGFPVNSRMFWNSLTQRLVNMAKWNAVFHSMLGKCKLSRRQQPWHAESLSSQISIKVEQLWAPLVPGWETVWMPDGEMFEHHTKNDLI